jgi:hypothetical protein
MSSKNRKGERSEAGDARASGLCPPEALPTCDIHIFPVHYRADLVRRIARDWWAAEGDDRLTVWQADANEQAMFFARWGFDEYQIRDNLLLLWRAVRREIDRLRDEAKG